MADEIKLPKGESESTRMGVVSNTLALIGFVLIAIVLVWGIFSVLKFAGFSFDNIFASSPSLSIEAPKGAISGQALTMSWKNPSTAPGTYAFLYQCQTNFAFATVGPTGVLNRVPCGTSISVGSSTSATMVPMVAASYSASVPFSVVFTPEVGGARISGSVTIAIAPPGHSPNTAEAAPMHSATSSPKTATPTPAKQSSRSLAPADIAVTIIATGYIDPASGALITNRAPSPYDVAAVEFDIANVGGATSRSYTFEAHLPTASAYTYNSSLQAPLAAGSHIMNTLRFTQLAQGGGVFTVVVHPNGDANETNDEAATTVY